MQMKIQYSCHTRRICLCQAYTHIYECPTTAGKQHTPTCVHSVHMCLHKAHVALSQQLQYIMNAGKLRDMPSSQRSCIQYTCFERI